MFKREVDRWVLWINDNLPTVAMLGETEVRRIVKRAINDFRAARFVISFCGTFLGALIGHFVFTLSIEPPHHGWQHMLVVIGFGTVFNFVTGKLGDSILVSKIESLASGA